MKRLLPLIFGFTLLPVLASADDPWPGQRGGCDARASLNAGAENAGLTEWLFNPGQRRRFQVGLSPWASPALAVVSGRPLAFIGGYDQALHAFDLRARQQLWLKLTNGPIADAPVVGELDGRPAVFFTSSDRNVYACDAASGRTLWTKELVPASSTLDLAQLTAPLLLGDRLYVGCFAYDRSLSRSTQKGWLIALERTSGRELWRVEISQGFVTAPAGRIVKGRVLVWICARKGLLQAFDVTGPQPQKIWQHQMAHEVLGSPALEAAGAAPRLFLGSKFGQLFAFDALSGKVLWKRMAGNWIDNTACVADLDGQSTVFTGSHDYNVYAFRAKDGEKVWRRRLGGEVYSAPCFFFEQGRPRIAVSCLDDHLYVLDAQNGKVLTAYFTGQPVWDKVNKGENLWGSPAVWQSGGTAAIVNGSYSGMIQLIPSDQPSRLTVKVRSSRSLWLSLAVTAALFFLVLLPFALYGRNES
jgi:outer membrane protein assembly factor BamB